MRKALRMITPGGPAFEALESLLREQHDPSFQKGWLDTEQCHMLGAQLVSLAREAHRRPNDGRKQTDMRLAKTLKWIRPSSTPAQQQTALARIDGLSRGIAGASFSELQALANTAGMRLEVAVVSVDDIGIARLYHQSLQSYSGEASP